MKDAMIYWKPSCQYLMWFLAGQFKPVLLLLCSSMFFYRSSMSFIYRLKTVYSWIVCLGKSSQ